MNTLSERIQFLMDHKKCDQIDISRGIGAGRSRVSEWVNGKVTNPRRATLRKLADFFNCRMEWIADGSGEIFSTSKSELPESGYSFQNQKKAKHVDETLTEIKREKFKIQCGAHFEEFFDFVADTYGENKEGADTFLSELQQTNPRYRQWLELKKRTQENSPDGSGKDTVAANE